MKQYEYPNYAERKAQRHIFSFALAITPPAPLISYLSATSCLFDSLPQTEECHFSVVEKDTCDGFGVSMRGVAVVPATSVIFTNPPWWVRWLAMRAPKSWFIRMED